MISVLIQRRFTHFDPAQRPRAFALAVVYWLAVASVLVVWLRWQRAAVDTNGSSTGAARRVEP
jgi:hypothetical protein